jgi:general secretion pathway protein L
MVRDFLRWWLSQLAELLPRSLRRSGAGQDDAVLVTPIGLLGQGIDAVALDLRRNGRETELGRFSLGAADLAQTVRAAGRPVVLRLPEGDLLGKTVSLPLAAERNLKQVLAFEMDRETPFAADELYWTHRVAAADRKNGRLSIRLLLVPKEKLAPLLRALGNVGLVPRRAEIASGPDAGSHLPLDDNGGRLDHRGNRLLWPLAACCAALAIAAVATPFVRQALVLSELDRQVAAARSAAAEAERLQREIRSLTVSAELIEKERGEAGRPLQILAAATGILPDDTYLSQLEIRDRKVTLSGRSAGAARLIGKLAASGEFRNLRRAGDPAGGAAYRSLHHHRGGCAVISFSEMPTGWRGRLLASILALAAIAAVYLVVVAPLVEFYAERTTKIEERRMLVPRLAAAAAELPRLRARVAALHAAARARHVTLDGASDAIASANLENRIEQLAASLGATVGSTESLTAQSRGDYRRIGVRLVLSGPYDTLVKLIAALETAAPPLIVANLQIHGILGRPGMQHSSAIDAGLDVYGFRHNTIKAAAKP